MTYPPDLDPSPRPNRLRTRVVRARSLARSSWTRVRPRSWLEYAGLAALAVFGLIVAHYGPRAWRQVAAPRFVEVLNQRGEVVSRYEVVGAVDTRAPGVVMFETADGRRLFVSGLWRVVEGGP